MISNHILRVSILLNVLKVLERDFYLCNFLFINALRNVNVTKFPESVTKFPRNVTKFPESVTKFPESVTKFPRGSIACPLLSHLGACPLMVAGVPRG